MVRYQSCAERFNREEFWEACMDLDQLWCQEPTDFCQGLIFLSAGYYHLQGRNLSGCCKLLDLAVEWLAPYAYQDQGGEVASAVRQAIVLTRMIRSDGLEVMAFPKLGGGAAPEMSAA